MESAKGKKLVHLEHVIRRVSVGFIVCIWILAPYILLQQFSLYEVTWLQETALDKMVPVYLGAVYIYFSYYLILAWAGFAVRRAVFVRFMKAVCMVALVSHLCFFFFPTGVSREGIDMSNAPLLYEWLVGWEKPRNCLPSLHGSLATLAMFALWQKGTISGMIASCWWAGVMWSTIALRQHVIIDLGAGILLAAVVWFVVVRKSSFPEAESVQKSEEA